MMLAVYFLLVVAGVAQAQDFYPGYPPNNVQLTERKVSVQANYQKLCVALLEFCTGMPSKLPVGMCSWYGRTCGKMVTPGSNKPLTRKPPGTVQVCPPRQGVVYNSGKPNCLPVWLWGVCFEVCEPSTPPAVG